ncbi:MAG: ATP-dependent DNA ligase [Bacteroidia bacterium]|nr:ATP-dependent DNA ligase [Bacteroidia bacterium]
MKLFAALFEKLESTNSTKAKTKILANFFAEASPSDALWVIALFSRKRPKRTVKTSQLRAWAAEEADIPLWLFEETYDVVGDLAETIAKVLPKNNQKSNGEKSLSEWISYNQALAKLEDDKKEIAIKKAWKELGRSERFLFNKLITGGFRMGVSQKTIVKALAQQLDQEENEIAHKLMGNWTPDTTTFDELLLTDNPTAAQSKPYPFYLTYALDVELDKIGQPEDWMAEYKWDGIRGQLIKREGQVYLWSRGEELITHQFPEFATLLELEDDFVIDGEILIFKEGKVQNFNILQKRLGRKSPSKKFIAERPAIIMLYDILEINGEDIRHKNQTDRREKLEELYFKNEENSAWQLSENIKFTDWTSLEKIREEARSINAEGLMLKSKSGAYKTGRKKGDWYKWKHDPLTLDVVMLYAQRGHGRRANLFSDFTFAVKSGDKLVPIAKAYSGLTDAELVEISKFVRANTIERFGPVSSVSPKLVFEIAFEAVFESSRHKSGVAVRFPRILRWRKDKKVDEINALGDLKKLISNN